MTPSSRTGVLICGAGPVGLALAAQLRRFQVPFRIIDRNAGCTALSKALVVWARTLEQLDTAAPVAPLLRAGLPVRRGAICHGDRQIGGIELAATDSPYGAGIMIPQSETERHLAEHLRTHGTTIEWQTELTAFEQSATGVACTIGRHDGMSEKIDADWLVGCDGAHSQIRRTLDLSFDGVTEPYRWVLADVAIDGRLPDAEAIIYWHASGMLALFRIDRDRWRIIASDPEPDQPDAPTLENIRQLVERRGPTGLRLRDPAWISAFHINERIVDRYRERRCFVAGDAAHVHSPAGGQGMNTGIQDALNLGWKLALRNHGLAGDRLLDSYHDERAPVGAAVVRETSRMLRMAMLANPLARFGRDTLVPLALRIPAIRSRAARMLTELDVAYPSSPLNGPGDARVCSLRPGQRVPPIRLLGCPDYEHLSDPLRDAAMLVVGWRSPPGSAESLLESAPDAWREHLIPLDLNADSTTGGTTATPAELRRLGLGEPGYLVIRPDGILALSARADRPTALRDWLVQLSR
ncbi:MAG: FAD-dependent monooxygenase [Methylotetracoccus sp.]